MKYLIVFGSLFLLTGCAWMGRQVTQAVNLAIPVTCVPMLPNAPDFPDTDARLRASVDVYERVKRMTAGRPQHFIYEAELLGALEACK